MRATRCRGRPSARRKYAPSVAPVATRSRDRRLDRVARRKACVAAATVLKMELLCDEAARERECARTVERASIRVRCGDSRADSYAPESAERTPPIRVEARGRLVAAPPRIRCATCGTVRRGGRVRPGDRRVVLSGSRLLRGECNEPSAPKQSQHFVTCGRFRTFIRDRGARAYNAGTRCHSTHA